MSFFSNSSSVHPNSIVALYGLGTETDNFLRAKRDELNIIGLLDGFCEEGELYGLPIISLDYAFEQGVDLIIVVARPGSCKAITKRIGSVCREKGIALYDVFGRNLLEQTSVRYDFSSLPGYTMQSLYDAIDKADIVSFDLFDTLVTRKVCSYTDIFELVDIRLKERGISISNFTTLRLFAEKELSKTGAPTLEDIYENVLEMSGESCISSTELVTLEWEIDRSLMIGRNAVIDIFQRITESGKKVIVVTDSYYTENRVKSILSEFEISGYDKIFVSCEYDTSKTLNLFDQVAATYNDQSVLHIGDDEIADISEASKRGFATYRLFKGLDLFDALGELGMENYLNDISDRLKCGLFISRLLNDPFCFENENKEISVGSSEDIGYLFCGPMITDFTIWMRERLEADNIEQILFCARDGYLFEKIYSVFFERTKSCYFLASRTAAIRAGMETFSDIDYVDSMKYSGSSEQALKARFGIDMEVFDEAESRERVLKKSTIQRENYRKYMNNTNIASGRLAMFDFVAKGTTQMYLERIIGRKMKGLYFLQLEPEYMSDKGLDIDPFYTEEEKNGSAIFDNYYILETILTSPFPQLLEFDGNGIPQYAEETRSERDIRCFENAQQGIMEFFNDYISILPERAWTENKKLDELFLSLINKISIRDEDFMSLRVEDPFFGRMTSIRDILEN